MTAPIITLIVILSVIAIIILFTIRVRNQLVVHKNQYETAFAQIDVGLTKRHDLIPNLVNVAKGYMEHEKSVLTEVTEARNQASKALNNAKQDPSSESLMGLVSKAEGVLSSSLGRLMAVVESYPDLKANEQMNYLSEQLSIQENEIATLRVHYNHTIQEYNNYAQIFPNNIVASMFNYKRMPWLPIEEGKSEVPKIEF